jgi:hypothetical protein
MALGVTWQVMTTTQINMAHQPQCHTKLFDTTTFESM